MPFVYDPNLDKKDEDQQGTSRPLVSGASTTYNANGSPESQPKGEGSTQTGSGFQNLDNYLKVNDAKGFAGQVNNKVSDQISGAEKQMDQAGEEFKQQVASSNKTPTQQEIDSDLADPVHADQKKWNDWRTQTYAGPQNLADRQDIWNRYWSGADQAQQNAKLLGSDAGRFTLLDQYFGRPSYNYGEKALDNFLVQQGGLGDQTKALQDQATQLTTRGVNKETSELQSAVSQRIGDIEKSHAQVRRALGIDDHGNLVTNPQPEEIPSENGFVGTGGFIGETRSPHLGAIPAAQAEVNAAVAQANADRKKQVDDWKAGLGRDRVSADQLAAMGLKEGQSIFRGVDLSDPKYFEQNADLNADQVMSPEQRARIRALSQLAGITDTFASGNPADRTSAVNYHSDLLASDLASIKAAYDREMRDTLVHPFAPGHGDDYTLAQLRDPNVTVGLHEGGDAFVLSPERRQQLLRDAENQLYIKYGLGRTINTPMI